MATTSSTKQQPPWQKPDESKSFISGLKVSNSLTLNKELFVPKQGKLVTWYMCGPTVYDASHMGHARTYLSFDIIRRILEDYFGYNVFMVMNITDIDDKIIIKARQNFLIAEYKRKTQTLTEETKQLLVKSLNDEIAKFNKIIEQNEKAEAGAESEKTATIKMFQGKIKTSQKTLDDVNAAAIGSPATALIEAASAAVAVTLDAEHGSTVDIQRLFREHAERYEKEYLQDMAALGIRPVDVMTRVSEYLDEIVKMVQGIIKNGFGYELDGSVYFDTEAFSKAPNHAYGKLAPWAVGDAALLAEGEGALTSVNKKKHPNDFALWKKSKPGEPRWSSPWGEGRPGWHIECSAMAGDVIGASMDLHSGGVDLKFPHHDNELAQAEAFFPCHQWVNYFLHTGHLHIEGLRMAKSLKNFVTIREALAINSARQIRLLFILRAWDKLMNYSQDLMKDLRDKEKYITEFFLLVKQVQRGNSTPQETASQPQRWRDAEPALLNAITLAQQEVDEGLKDNFDTPRAMAGIFALIGAVYTYSQKAGTQRRALLITKAANFVTKILKVFGLIGDDEKEWSIASGVGTSSTSSTTAIEPYVALLAKFRATVRAQVVAGFQQPDAKATLNGLLTQCDILRNELLPPLGVRLEDSVDFPDAFKLVDAAELMKEIADAKATANAEKEKKLKARLDASIKELEKAEKSAVSPNELFRSDPAAATLYASYDADGIPDRLVVKYREQIPNVCICNALISLVCNNERYSTATSSSTDGDGDASAPGEVSKSAKKKFVKLREAQVKLHEQVMDPNFPTCSYPFIHDCHHLVCFVVSFSSLSFAISLRNRHHIDARIDGSIVQFNARGGAKYLAQLRQTIAETKEQLGQK